MTNTKRNTYIQKQKKKKQKLKKDNHIKSYTKNKTKTHTKKQTNKQTRRGGGGRRVLQKASADQMIVAVGDSGLCSWVPMTSFGR